VRREDAPVLCRRGVITADGEFRHARQNATLPAAGVSRLESRVVAVGCCGKRWCYAAGGPQAAASCGRLSRLLDQFEKRDKLGLRRGNEGVDLFIAVTGLEESSYVKLAQPALDDQAAWASLGQKAAVAEPDLVAKHSAMLLQMVGRLVVRLGHPSTDPSE
jgi:hypothetical protein